MLTKTITTTLSLVLSAHLAQAQLIDGNTLGEAFEINTGTLAQTAIPGLGGTPIYGMAADDANQVIYFVSSSELYSWNYGDAAPTLLGLPTDPAGQTAARMDGLAFGGGQLWVSNQQTYASATMPAGLYTIDVNTLMMTQVMLWGANDLPGGLGYDDNTDLLYATNDGLGNSVNMLSRVDPVAMTITNIAPYPAGVLDVDGCTVGGGRAYLIQDDVGDPIEVYNITTGMYEAPIPVAITGSTFVCGGAWAPTLFCGPVQLGMNDPACGPLPHSMGGPAVITLFGSGCAGDVIEGTCRQGPPGNFGYFISGPNPGLYIVPPMSTGIICIGNPQFRYNSVPLSQVFQFDANGVSQAVMGGGPSILPTDGSFAPVPAVTSMGTRYFQAWYRDVAPFNSNFSNSLGVTFL